MIALVEKDQSLAASLFNKFYSQFQQDGFIYENIISNFLPDFVEEVAEEWGEEITVSGAQGNEINESRPVIECEDRNNKLFIVTANGSVYKTKKITKKNGGKTWNGDDEYFDSIIEEYVDPVLIGKLENLKDSYNKQLTAYKLERTACELVSLICQ